jgi:hypothetical protein
MVELTDEELLEIGRAAAAEVLGAPAVVDLRVKARLDEYDKIVYDYILVIDWALAMNYRPGHVTVDIGHKIQDKLWERGDETFPILRITSPEEWRSGAFA